MSKKDAVWFPVAIETLPKGHLAAYQEFKALQDKANKAKAAFHQTLVMLMVQKGKIEKGQEIILGTRWGLLSYAIKDPTEGKSPKNAVRFDD
jgi:hypothetical protein